ncbi:MAG: PTS sugar transporter subunit IIA [Planctomycetota bacterium]
MSISLMDILTEQTIRVPMEHTDKRACIDELVDVLAAAGHVADAASLKQAVWAREQTRTTGIGHALAIPHGKCESVDRLAMAIGRPAQPVNFDSIDDQPVRLIVLLASPIDRTSDHIQALAQISRLMADATFRGQVFDAASPPELFALLQGRVLATA